MKKLNAKQARFVDEYLVDMNATQAAIRAGYSKKTARQQGARLLSNAAISHEVEKRRHALSEEAKVTVGEIIKRLDEISLRCMQHHPVRDKKGEQVYVLTPEGELAPAYTFDASGANRSLELIGKHLGAWVEKHEHSGPGGTPLVNKVEIEFVEAASE